MREPRPDSLLLQIERTVIRVEGERNAGPASAGFPHSVRKGGRGESPEQLGRPGRQSSTPIFLPPTSLCRFHRDCQRAYMKIYVYPAEDVGTMELARKIRAMIHQHYDLAATLEESDLAIVPSPACAISKSESAAPQVGTLAFHPSLLPLLRGNAPIACALGNGDRFTGATWYWLDREDAPHGGDICEQELVAIPKDTTPVLFDRTVMMPAAVRTLERALFEIARGVVRRIPQDDAASTECAHA